MSHRTVRGGYSVPAGIVPVLDGRYVDQWAYLNGVALDFIRRGKPTDNAFIEAFNGRLRQECLNKN